MTNHFKNNNSAKNKNDTFTEHARKVVKWHIYAEKRASTILYGTDKTFMHLSDEICLAIY